MSLNLDSTDRVVSGAAVFAAQNDQVALKEPIDSITPLDHDDAVELLMSATRSMRLVAAVLADEMGTTQVEVLRGFARFAAGS